MAPSTVTCLLQRRDHAKTCFGLDNPRGDYCGLAGHRGRSRIALTSGCPTYQSRPLGSELLSVPLSACGETVAQALRSRLADVE
jgi:hypothetical protein